MKIILKNIILEFLTGTFDVDEFIDVQIETENPEFKSAIIDADDRLLWGRYSDSTTTDYDLTGYEIDGIPVTKIVNKIIEKYNL